MTQNEFMPVRAEVVDETASGKIQQAMEMAIARQAKEVEAQALMAKKFPRDESKAVDRILDACKRRTMADCACYQFPRGGELVTGGSIHLARMMASYWGNVTHGFVELARDDVKGESHVMCYAWDVETNARECRVVVVPHYRDTKRGRMRLTSDRDIYEHIANVAARRTRECIFDVIPRDVRDMAIEQANKTLAQGHEKPLEERIVLMIEAFKSYGVTESMLAARWQKPVRSFNERDMIRARQILASIKDGLAEPHEFFDESASVADAEKPAPSSTSKTESLARKVAKGKSSSGSSKKKSRSRKKSSPPDEPEQEQKSPGESKAEEKTHQQSSVVHPEEDAELFADMEEALGDIGPQNPEPADDVPF